ncbi:MAG: Cys-Gln thioester bond-forming surface protein [Clostridia bacterium]|nr:Cys-Gln thioester bond-forming surface protein [Clostridia bacterium]
MKRLIKLLSLLLMLCIITSTAAISVSAAEIINGNTWYGADVSVDVTAGTEGYNYMALFRKPIHGYEFSGHFIGGTEAAQTFVVIDSDKYDATTWTPNGVYELGKSNYDVTYCCDIETMVVDGVYYKKMNLDESEYYTPEQARKIRAIVSNSYPYVTFEEMKASLAENGFEYAEDMKRGEIISAVQAAIWASANGKSADELRYDRTYRVTDNFQWGQPVHDISDEAGYDVKGKRTFAVYEDVRVRHDALVDYLLALPGVDAGNGQIVITKLDILNCKVDNTEDQYEVTINVALNQGADEDDDIVINTYLNGKTLETVKVGEASSYTFKFNAFENSHIKVEVSGTQKLERGVYFYAPEPADTNGDGIKTSREVSQNFVGVSVGETPVYADAELTFHDGVLEAKKLSNKKDSSRFEVSVEVPGEGVKVTHDETILMVDGSYSMDEEWPEMKEAILSIGESVLDGNGYNLLTLMAFGMGENEVLVHVETVEELAAALGELPGNLLYGRSSTNCEAGLSGVAKYIENHDETLDDVTVIFISDGNVNTDETPRAFDANWKTWSTEYGALSVAKSTFECALVLGNKLPDAFTAVFGNRFADMSIEDVLKSTFEEGAVSEDEFFAFAEQIWTDVYAYSSLTRGTEYPISVAERAFVKYDKEKGTAVSELFYSTIYKSSYVTYDDSVARTTAAAEKLAAMDEVLYVYVVDYDEPSDWMDGGITNEKALFVQSEGIEGLTDVLTDSLDMLSSTMYFNVTVTDYMSKWAILDLDSIKVVDAALDKVIWSAKDGWLIDENRPTTHEIPVIAEIVDPEDYADGGEDVVGNKNGDIFVLTWYVKDAPLLRADNYKLVYEVELDVDEDGFAFGSPYPTNGKTELDYNGNQTTVIDPPKAKTPGPVSVEFSGVKYLDGQLASDFTFCLKDVDGNIIGEAKSKEDGSFSFDPIKFREEGTYKFTVSEVVGDEATYTYDETVYEITVVVTGDEEKLYAEVSGAAKIEFYNETVPVPGDSSGRIIFVIVAIASLTIAFKLRKKSKPRL